MAPSETLRKTARTYIHALSNLEIDTLSSLFAPDFYLHLSPASALLGDKHGDATRELYIKRLTGLKSIVSSGNFSIEKEWPPNEASNQAILRVTISTDFRPEVIGDDDKKDWVFENETLFIFTMDESGEKVKKLESFTDSLSIQKMPKLFEKATSRLGHEKLPGTERLEAS